MNKYSVLILVIFFLTVFSCQIDDVEPQQVLRESTYKQVKADEIPEVIDAINQALSFSSERLYLSNSVERSAGQIRMDRIMEMIDTLDNLNYTFKVNDGDQNPFTFSNLVVKKRADGTIDAPLLYKYRLDSAHRESFVNGGFSMENFVGTVEKEFLKEFEGNRGRSSANLIDSRSSGGDCQPQTEQFYVGNSSGLNDGSVTGYGPSTTTTYLSAGIVKVCVTYFDVIESSGEPCNEEVHELFIYNGGDMSEHTCSTGEQIVVRRSRCMEYYVNSPGGGNDGCYSGDTEDFILINPALDEYIELLASELPDWFVKIDPALFWEFMWKNGYIDPFGAGLLEGAYESLAGLVDIAEFLAAWDIRNPIIWSNPRSVAIREQTVMLVAYMKDLIFDSSLRQDLYQMVKSELSQYIDLLTFQNGSNEALHEWGKIVFNVAAAWTGASVVNSMLKTYNIADKMFDLIRIMPDDAVVYLARARKILNDADAHVTIKQSIDALNDVDATIDAIQTIEKPKPTWEQIKALFKRGRDFNKKASASYPYNEIHLENGKRLDSYIPGEEIVSRKATTLANIQPSTFEKYLRELTTKYKKGTIIRSNKYGTAKLGNESIDGQELSGDYFLEIPTSNKEYFDNSPLLQSLAKKYDVQIKYLDE